MPHEINQAVVLPFCVERTHHMLERLYRSLDDLPAVTQEFRITDVIPELKQYTT